MDALAHPHSLERCWVSEEMQEEQRAAGDGPRFVEYEWQTPGRYADAARGWRDRGAQKRVLGILM